MAAWQVRPPRLVTTAAAIFITVPQSGMVVSATSTSPGWNWLSSDTSLMTRARPVATLPPTARPLTQGLALGAQPVFFDHAQRLARGHGFRPRLNDVELAVHAVLGPFDVHRRRLAGLAAVVRPRSGSAASASSSTSSSLMQ